MGRSKLNVAITMGDAAGIGPEVTLKALADEKIRRLANFLIIGNRRVLEDTARLSKIKLKDEIAVLDAGEIPKLEFGRSSSKYGRAALQCIQEALTLIKTKKIDLLVTAPVNKHTISQCGFPFTGHTEYLARACRVKNFAMLLTGGPFKVVLATRHIALREVPQALTKEGLYQTLRLAIFGLKRYFGIRRPRLGVCALNPHGGDKGLLGREESEIIGPAVHRAKKTAQVEGPLPADSLFYLARQGKFDAVIAMYHDQGLIPLKAYAFDQGVNLTLGLPFVRTSPDHGTAYDIAGKNKANPRSMMEAIKLAVKIGSRKD